MSGACSAYVERRGIYRIWWVNLREREHFGNPGIDGRIILRWFRIRTVGWHL
jgi:hypothetical protein